MSGVQVGTRLQQLEELRRRLDHEIEQERARHDGGRIRRQPTEQKRRSPTTDPVKAALAALGVTTGVVRRWAVAAGHEVGDRGPASAGAGRRVRRRAPGR